MNMEMEELSETILIINDEEVFDAETLSLRNQFKGIIVVATGHNDESEEYSVIYKKFREFRKLIDDSTISLCCRALESYEPDSPMSLFEYCCNTGRRELFIKECLFLGCDPSQRNPKCGRRPISFAIENFHDKNLEALLCETTAGVEFQHSSDVQFTPINYVLERIRNDDTCTFEQKYKCFELLVKHCANVNAPGKDGRTPIRFILEEDNLNKERKRTLVKCIFDHAKYFDIDGENGEVRARLTELVPQFNELIPQLELLPSGKQEFDFDRCLHGGYESELWKYLSNNEYDCKHNARVFRGAVENGLIYSVERMLRPPNNFLTGEFFQTMFVWASHNDFTFKSEKCLYLILNDGRIDVNQISNDYTLLLCSLTLQLSNVTAKLLDLGAYFATDDGSEKKTLLSIKPQLLDKHFDSCITTKGRTLNDEKLQLIFDYKNLIPIHKVGTLLESKNKFCEMKAVELISKSDTLRPLLRHPLIESFVELKWNQLAPMFYANFFVYFAFAMLNIFQIFFFFLDDVESAVSMAMSGVLMFFLCAMIVREAFQMICSPLVYFKRWQNYLECALIGLISFILFGNCPIDWRGTVAAVAILLITYELCLLLGTLPIRFFATHFVMLETVATSFFKSLLFYSVIIVAFALTFCSLFHKLSSDANARNFSLNETDEEEEKYNNFQSIGLSLLKSLVMANGELDASSIHLNSNPFSYVAFVAFVLIVTTVLGNLLSGLAVSDINHIRSQAELIHLSRRCEVLAEHERIFLNRRSLRNRFPKLERYLRSRIWLFADYRMRYQETFMPNSKDSRLPIDEDILKEALQRASKGAKTDGNEKEIEVLGNKIEVLGNQIAKIAESTKESIQSLQHEIDCIGKIMKSIEKLLEQR